MERVSPHHGFTTGLIQIDELKSVLVQHVREAHTMVIVRDASDERALFHRGDVNRETGFSLEVVPHVFRTVGDDLRHDRPLQHRLVVGGRLVLDVAAGDKSGGLHPLRGRGVPGKDVHDGGE